VSKKGFSAGLQHQNQESVGKNYSLILTRIAFIEKLRELCLVRGKYKIPLYTDDFGVEKSALWGILLFLKQEGYIFSLRVPMPDARVIAHEWEDGAKELSAEEIEYLLNKSAQDQLRNPSCDTDSYAWCQINLGDIEKSGEYPENIEVRLKEENWESIDGYYDELLDLKYSKEKKTDTPKGFQISKRTPLMFDEINNYLKTKAGRKCEIPKIGSGKNTSLEYLICKTFFCDSKPEELNWDEVYEEIFGEECFAIKNNDDFVRKSKKRITDAVKRINKKTEKNFGIAIFRVEGDVIIRNISVLSE
jgi:hypothetical protein